MSQLLAQQPVGDRWPLKVVRRMRQLAGEAVFYKTLANLHSTGVDTKLAEIADLIVDTTRKAEIQEVPVHRPSASHETSSVVEDLQNQVQNLSRA